MPVIPEHVIRYYASKRGLSAEAASTTFAELEAFLKFASSGLGRPSPLVDEAWHDFLLHTNEYSAYCQQSFGSFVHHVPDLVGSTATFDGATVSSGCSSNCSSRSSRVE